MKMTAYKEKLKKIAIDSCLSRRDKGIGLVETTIAVAILAVAGGALITMGLTTASLTTSSKLKTRATALASLRIEQLRACRDETNLLPTVPTAANCPDVAPSPIEGIFTRTTEINDSNPGVLVKVEVSWQERGREKKVVLETKLSQWRVKEATQ